MSSISNTVLKPPAVGSYWQNKLSPWHVVVVLENSRGAVQYELRQVGTPDFSSGDNMFQALGLQAFYAVYEPVQSIAME